MDVPKKTEIAERSEAIMFVREANKLSSWGGGGGGLGGPGHSAGKC